MKPSFPSLKTPTKTARRGFAVNNSRLKEKFEFQYLRNLIRVRSIIGPPDEGNDRELQAGGPGDRRPSGNDGDDFSEMQGGRGANKRIGGRSRYTGFDHSRYKSVDLSLLDGRGNRRHGQRLLDPTT